MKLYISVVKELKIKVRNSIPTFGEVAEEKSVGDLFAPHPYPILNRVKKEQYGVLFKIAKY